MTAHKEIPGLASCLLAQSPGLRAACWSLDCHPTRERGARGTGRASGVGSLAIPSVPLHYPAMPGLSWMDVGWLSLLCHLWAMVPSHVGGL